MPPAAVATHWKSGKVPPRAQGTTVTLTTIPEGLHLHKILNRASKKKVIGCFRSEKGADDYARVASLISTLRKQKLNVFDTIRDAFSGIPPPFVPSPSSPGD